MKEREEPQERTEPEARSEAQSEPEAPGGALAPAPHAAPDSTPEGGESVCWLDRVCPECGRLADTAPPTVCARCGSPLDRD